jgi:hypothetical protein
MTSRAVRFARSLALLSGSSLGAAFALSSAACGGAQTPSTTSPTPSSSASASATATATEDPRVNAPTDGPCRCSWDTNADAAPRVCKRGEINFEGTACVPGGGSNYYPNKKYPMPVPGPLPPPELRARRGKARAKRAR